MWHVTCQFVCCVCAWRPCVGDVKQAKCEGKSGPVETRLTGAVWPYRVMHWHIYQKYQNPQNTDSSYSPSNTYSVCHIEKRKGQSHWGGYAWYWRQAVHPRMAVYGSCTVILFQMFVCSIYPDALVRYHFCALCASVHMKTLF